MPYNQNNFDLQEKHEHSFNLITNQEQKFNLTLQNQYSFGLNIFGFTVSNSIYVKLRHTLRTVMGFLLKSKIHSISKVNLKTIINYKMIKKYFININQSVKTRINFLMIKKIKCTLKSGLRIGKIGTLGLLDEFILSDLDSRTLDQLNFINGIVLKIKKMMLMSSKSAVLSTVDINLYRYGKLLNYDGLSLSNLDNQNLGNLDRTIIN